MYKFEIFILYLLVSLIQLASEERMRYPQPVKEHYDLGWRDYTHSRFQLPHNHYYIRRRTNPPPTHTVPMSRSPVRNENKNDPYAPYDPPLPDFRAPGRRISDVKCFEYIWQLKVREDKAQRRQNCETSRIDHPVSNIIEGCSTSRGEYPNMGAIGWKAVVGKWKFLCGGSLISAKFLLTAAHCSSVSERDTNIADVVLKIVRLGDKNISSDDIDSATIPIDIEIMRIIVHPNYKSPKQYFDIALMELRHKVEFSIDVQPACLWAKNNFSLNSQAEVTGWGSTNAENQNTMSNELLSAEVDIIDSSNCNSLLQHSCNRNWCGLEDHQLCAGKIDGGADTCKGDSGGPLSVKIPLPIATQGNMHFILGVTSFGVGCGLPGKPGIYTKVYSFVDWIEENVWLGL